MVEDEAADSWLPPEEEVEEAVVVALVLAPFVVGAALAAGAAGEAVDSGTAGELASGAGSGLETGGCGLGAGWPPPGPGGFDGAPRGPVPFAAAGPTDPAGASEPPPAAAPPPRPSRGRDAAAPPPSAAATRCDPGGASATLPWTASVLEGSAIGPSERSGQPGWEKRTTRPRPSAAVIPSIAKVVLRIRSGSRRPAQLGSLAESFRSLEPTTSAIDGRRRHP